MVSDFNFILIKKINIFEHNIICVSLYSIKSFSN